MKKVTIILSLTSLFLGIYSCGNNTQNTVTTPSVDTATAQVSAAETNTNEVVITAEISDLLSKNTCLTCHDANEKIVGPPYVEIAKRNYTSAEIVELIYKPKPSNWPDYITPMVGLPNVPKEEALKIAEWIISLK